MAQASEPADRAAVTLTTRNRIFGALSLIIGAAGINALITGASGGVWIGVPAATLSILAAVASLRGGTAR